MFDVWKNAKLDLATLRDSAVADKRETEPTEHNDKLEPFLLSWDTIYRYMMYELP